MRALIVSRRSMLAIAAALAVVAALAHAGEFAPAMGDPLDPPSLRHWFGTDDLGRDLFAGVVEGARLSLLVGAGVTTFALLLGTLVGVTAGYRGGLLDEALMRVVEVFQILPRFFLALAALTLWGGHWVHLVVVLGLTSWTGLARIARAETLAVRELAFVEAARSSGAASAAILSRHVLPSVARPLLAAASFVAAGAMLAEAGLSFLGLSTTEGVSWGYLLLNAQPFLREAWWMALFPGLAITLSVFALAWIALAQGEDFYQVIR